MRLGLHAYQMTSFLDWAGSERGEGREMTTTWSSDKPSKQLHLPCSCFRSLCFSYPEIMSRRGVGLGAFANRNQTTQSYATHGANLRSTHLASLQNQLSVFQSLLHTFALEHSTTISPDLTVSLRLEVEPKPVEHSK